MTPLEIIGGTISIAGGILLFLAALGLIRMPDVYNRMQAGTKATTLGSMLFLIGIAFVKPEWSAKIVVIILFIVFTNPISSHALARAAHFVGIRMTERTVRDDLARDDAEAERSAARAGTADNPASDSTVTSGPQAEA